MRIKNGCKNCHGRGRVTMVSTAIKGQRFTKICGCVKFDHPDDYMDYTRDLEVGMEDEIVRFIRGMHTEVRKRITPEICVAEFRRAFRENPHEKIVDLVVGICIDSEKERSSEV